MSAPDGVFAKVRRTGFFYAMDYKWGELDIEEGAEVSRSIGGLSLRVIRSGDIYRMHLDGESAVWARSVGWHDAHVGTRGTLRLEPATPDLPIVLRPSNPVALSCGEVVQYRVLLPLWIRVTKIDPGCEGTQETLFDVPSRILKRTWFGAVDGGEIAYVRRFEPQSRESYQRHQYVVPVTIRNSSDSVLWFERFLLRVVHHDLYRFEDCIESNGVTVTFKGREQLSQISFESGREVLSRGGELVSTSRVPAGSDIIRKSFLWLKSLAG